MDFLRRRGMVIFISDLLMDRDLAMATLRFLRHRGHQVLVLHILDPAEVSLAGPAEARFEDPESRESVILRPADWAEAYAETVRHVTRDWNVACRQFGIAYHQVLTSQPFGDALREALAAPRGP
jgi:hypothetical protein